MKVYIISDEEYQTAAYEKLFTQVLHIFKSRGDEIKQKHIKKGELHFCIGCFGCWIKKPGECMLSDHMADVNQTYNDSDVVIYLTPIVFGQYSPNIKHALDRWIPNILPLFVKKQDGTTGHPLRYRTNPKQVIVGYGDKVSQQEAQLFKRVVKHRPNVDVFVYAEGQDDVANRLEKMNLESVRA